MVCPIMSNRIVYIDGSTIDCREKECAWWNENCGKCAIAVLAENSETLGEAAAGQRIIYTKEV